jgi:hypothetical protein
MNLANSVRSLISCIRRIEADIEDVAVYNHAYDESINSN